MKRMTFELSNTLFLPLRNHLWVDRMRFDETAGQWFCADRTLQRKWETSRCRKAWVQNFIKGGENELFSSNAVAFRTIQNKQRIFARKVDLGKGRSWERLILGEVILGEGRSREMYSEWSNLGKGILKMSQSCQGKIDQREHKLCWKFERCWCLDSNDIWSLYKYCKTATLSSNI